MDERCRKNMLTRMLLKMIQPSWPIDTAVNCVANLRRWSLYYVQDTVVFNINAINHAGIAKRPGIHRLSTAGWIKCGAIERQRNLAIIEFAETDDARIEFQQT
jgi:hypothetical protein